jgi:hypothetical protein
VELYFEYGEEATIVPTDVLKELRWQTKNVLPRAMVYIRKLQRSQHRLRAYGICDALKTTTAHDKGRNKRLDAYSIPVAGNARVKRLQYLHLALTALYSMLHSLELSE